MERRVICALDTANLDEALSAARQLAPHVGAIKIGHALTLQYGLEVIKMFQDVGIARIFLDLKFHDIPNSVALAVREAARYKVWMLTLHIAGGPAMMTAAVEEAQYYGEDEAPLLIGVSVLTSLDQHTITDHLGIGRTIDQHMVYLSKLAVDCGLDGVVSSPHEVRSIRTEIGHAPVLVCPGIRPEGSAMHDQKRVGTARQALDDGADYLVVGRALAGSRDICQALASLGLGEAGTPA